MKLFMKTRLSVIAIAIAIMLSACSGGNTGGSGNATDASQSTKTPASANQEVKMETIRVWTNSGHTKDQVTAMVGEFNNTIGKEKGIKIEYTVQGADYQQAVDLALTSDQAPELFYVMGSKVDYVKRGDILPIADFPGGEEFLKKYEGMLQRPAFTIDGQVYAVPFNITNLKLLYNKELFVKAGIVDANGEAKAPETWDQVREYAKQLTNPQEKTYGIALPLKWAGYFEWDLMFPWVSSIGHNYFDVTKGEYAFKDFKPAFEWLLAVKEDKSYFPGPEGLDNDPARAQFSEGRVAMKLGASWDVGVLNDQFPAKIEWGAADVPVLDPNQRYKDFATVADWVSISKTAKKANAEKVMEVYKWMNSDEFLVHLYEEGKFLPYDNRITQMAKKEPEAKGWSDFGKSEKIYLHHGQPAVKLEGDAYSQAYLRIWSEEATIDEVLNDLDERYTEAMNKGIADGSINLEMFKHEDFDFSWK